MFTPSAHTPPAPAREAVTCMCEFGGACSEFAPGHAAHLIQYRLTAATPAEWRDAIVVSADVATGELELAMLDADTSIRVWNRAGAARFAPAGTPVAWHPRYHALAVGERRFNIAA